MYERRTESEYAGNKNDGNFRGSLRRMPGNRWEMMADLPYREADCRGRRVRRAVPSIQGVSTASSAQGEGAEGEQENGGGFGRDDDGYEDGVRLGLSAGGGIASGSPEVDGR